jgi:deleted-in-malignant-brain-tumors protein 1
MAGVFVLDEYLSTAATSAIVDSMVRGVDLTNTASSDSPNRSNALDSCRCNTNLQFGIANPNGASAVQPTLQNVIVQDTWLTVVARYRASTGEYWLTVNSTATVDGTAVSTTATVSGTASAAVTDKTLSGTYIGKDTGSGSGGDFNGDMAGVFVLDEYLSTAATTAIVDSIVRGVDLTDTFFDSPKRRNALASCSCNVDLQFGIANPNATLVVQTTLQNVIEQHKWLTVVARYRASTGEYWLTVNNVTVSGTATAPVTDKTLSGTYIGKGAGSGGELNGDMAGVFVVDEYLSTAATNAIAEAQVWGVDLTNTTSSDSPAFSVAFASCTCISGYQIGDFRFFDIRGDRIAPVNAINLGGRNNASGGTGLLGNGPSNPFVYGASNGTKCTNSTNSTKCPITKFLDFNIQPVVFTFDSGASAMSYEWVTGDDAPIRDMISWRLEGKRFATDAAWTTLHTVSNYSTTLIRNAAVGKFYVPWNLFLNSELPTKLFLNSFANLTNSTPCARYFALVAGRTELARPSFSSVSTRGMGPADVNIACKDKGTCTPYPPPLGSAILPVYNASGGPQGKGHVTFDRNGSQFLDAGPRTLNIATNGGLTIVAVVRFTGSPGSYERIIDLGNGATSAENSVVLGRERNTSNLMFEIRNGASAIASTTVSGAIVQNSWLTVVARYRASTREYWLTVNNAVESETLNATVRLAACRSDGCCRVEVFNNGSWGTICDDDWGAEETRVACRQMGCGGTRYIQEFGGGSGRIWMDNIACNGSEASINSCSFGGWGAHDCDHEEDIGVCCTCGIASASVTNRTLSGTYMGRSRWFSNLTNTTNGSNLTVTIGNNTGDYFNGDIAGVFVVDEYLSTDATSAIADAMVRGVDLTDDCACRPSLTTGKISDGPMNYNENMNCSWLIAAELGKEISLSFTSFSTQKDLDFVTIYRCLTSNCSSDSRELVARLSGNLSNGTNGTNCTTNGTNGTNCTTIYKSSTGYLQLVFTSDGSNQSNVRNSTGFIAEWKLANKTLPNEWMTPRSFSEGRWNTETTCKAGVCSRSPGDWELAKAPGKCIAQGGICSKQCTTCDSASDFISPNLLHRAKNDERFSEFCIVPSITSARQCRAQNELLQWSEVYQKCYGTRENNPKCFKREDKRIMSCRDVQVGNMGCAKPGWSKDPLYNGKYFLPCLMSRWNSLFMSFVFLSLSLLTLVSLCELGAVQVRNNFLHTQKASRNEKEMRKKLH